MKRKGLTCGGFTRASLHLRDRGQTLLKRLPAHRLQLTDVSVSVPVAAADFVAHLAAADALGEPLSPGVFALQPVAARQVVLAPARVALPVRADQAAVAAVRDVPTGAAGARTAAHIAPLRAFGSGFGSGEILNRK